MKIYKSYRYELKPNNEQQAMLIKCVGVARFVWNWAISQRDELYKEKKFVNAKDQHKEIIKLKKTEYPWLSEVSKWIPQESLRYLDKAWDSYNERRVSDIPKKKKKGNLDSFRLGAPIIVKPRKIRLPKLGYIRVKEDTCKLKGRILAATVSRDVDKWFVSVEVICEENVEENICGDVVGVDLGIKDFAVVSNGESVERYKSPRPMMNNLKKLKRLSRSFSRKKVGSNNFKKEKVKIGRFYRRMRNQRKDFLTKLSSKLAKTKSVIIIEDLPTKGLMGNKKLARSIADMGWGNFKRMLEYKTQWYGSKLMQINRFEPSSKTCSECGSINSELVLSDRVWICQECGYTHDRDENAAKNIRRLGMINTDGSSEINACGVVVRPYSKKAGDVEARNGKTHRTAELLAKSKSI